MITRRDIVEMINNAETQTINLDEIIFDQRRYSRVNGIDHGAVEDYSHNIVGIPPIIINRNKIIINGVHRYKALQRTQQTSALIKVIDIEDDMVSFAGLVLDMDNGVRHPEVDIKKMCVGMFDGNSETDKFLMEELRVPERTYRRWTQDIRKEKQEAINRNMIMDYLKYGKTHEEIAIDYGVNTRTIERLKKIITDNLANVAGMSVEELSDSSLSFIRDAVNFKPHIYNIWNLAAADKNTSHFGHFPENFMANLLYYHTEPFDIVCDVFAGSGTTIDICKKMMRRYHCSDLNPKPDRADEIERHDVADGIPDNIRGIDLLFLDPPYWRQAKGKYSDDSEDLGNMSLEDFYNSMKIILDSASTKKVKKVAIVIQPTQYANDGHAFEDHIFEFDKMLPNYSIEMRYILPYSSEQYNAQVVEKMKSEKKCMVLNRDLVVWRLK